MKACAMTMVYRDYWALSQWYVHYGRLVGFDNLYIVAHGADAAISDICPKASIITIPRDALEGFDRRRGRMLNSFADGLGLTYDWVIRTDADELICFDPGIYDSLAEVFDKAADKALFALGLNLAETVEDEVLSNGQMALGHRKSAILSGHYSKAWASKRGTALWRHGIWVGPRKLASAPYDLPEGVFLVHLKYANLEALEAANQHRVEVANTPGKGLPGPAWKDPDRDAARFYEKLASYPQKDWPAATAEAHTALVAEPVRDEKENVLRSQSIQFKHKVILPSWFKTAFGLDTE